MTFGKPGRPPEDRLLRQREIFAAVAPLILTHGPRRFSMAEAAHAACLSVGGLYHYFPTKRDLVLHGLNPEARSRICAEESARLANLAHQPPETLLDGCVAALMRAFSFIRPSVLAALDLGDTTLQDTLDSRWMQDVGELATGFRLLLPAASADDLESLARAVRRFVLAALIDRNVAPEQVRADLRTLIGARITIPASAHMTHANEPISP